MAGSDEVFVFLSFPENPTAPPSIRPVKPAAHRRNLVCGGDPMNLAWSAVEAGGAVEAEAVAGGGEHQLVTRTENRRKHLKVEEASCTVPSGSEGWEMSAEN